MADFVPIDPSIVDEETLPVEPEVAPPGVGGTAVDVNNAAGSGIKKAYNETQRFIAKAADTIGAPLAAGANALSNAVGLGDIATSNAQGTVENFTFDESYKPITAAGAFVEPTAQFLAGFIGAGKLLGAAKGFQSLGTIGKGFVSGAVADAVVTAPSQDRLSNLFNEFAAMHPELRNPLTDYLAANENDSDAEGRLKNALEGAVTGGVLEAAFAGLRGLRRVWKAKERGGDEAAAKVWAQVADELEAGAGIEPKTGFKEGEIGGGTREGADSTITQVSDDALTSETTAVSKVAAENRAVRDINKPLLDDAELASIKNQIKDNPDWLSQGEVRPNQHYNFDRLDTDDGAKLALDEVAKAVDPMLAAAGRSYKSLDSIKNLAEGFSDRPEELVLGLTKLYKDTRQIEAHLVAGRALVTGLAKKAADLARKIEMDPSVLPELEKVLQQTANVDKLVRGVRSNTARATTAGRIRPAASLSAPEIKALQAAGADPSVFLKIVQEPPLWVKVLKAHNEYWINSLLSGPRTHIRNIISNAIQTVGLPTERIVGGLVTGNMESIKNGLGVFMGLRSALMDSMSLAAKASGLPDAARSLRKGEFKKAGKDLKDSGGSILDPGNTKDNQTRSRNLSTDNFKSLQGTRMGTALDAFGVAANIPGRFLATADEFFKQLNYRAQVYANATDEGLAQGLKNKDLAAFIESRINNAFHGDGSASDIQALAYARRATFTTAPEPGSFMFKLETLGNAHPAVKLILPFIRTPTNILKEAAIRTPLLNAVSSKYRQALAGKLGKEAQADAWGKMATGGTLWGAAMALSLEGRITGRGPADPREKQVLMATGWRPYSFKVGDEYVSFDGFDPVSMFFGVAGDFADAYGHMDDPTKKNVMGSMLIAMATNLTSKSYLLGLTQAMDALTQPGTKGANFIKSRIASYVPSAFKQMAGLIPSLQDPYLRETRTVLDAVMNRLPGFSESLPPKRNIFGEAMTAGKAFGPDSISPFYTSSDLGDKAATELARFSHAFSAPSESMGTVDLTSLVNAKGQDFYDRWQEQVGTLRVGRYTMKERLAHLVESPSYQKWRGNEADALEIGQEPKTLREVRKVIEEYRQFALQKTMKEYPEAAQMIRAEKVAGKRAGAGVNIPDSLKALLQPQ